MKIQRRQQNGFPGLEKQRPGGMPVTTGQIQREEAPLRQVLRKKKIGELSISAGHVKSCRVKSGVKLRLAAAIIAALSLSNIAAVEQAHAGRAAASTKINITAAVRDHAAIELLNQVNELVVTDADVDRGYVEVPAAAHISVKTNNPAGCLLAFEMVSDSRELFNEVYVRVGGREVQLSSGSGWVEQPYNKGGLIQDVGYRFVLSRKAQPGTYAWPLTISVLPLSDH